MEEVKLKEQISYQLSVTCFDVLLGSVLFVYLIITVQYHWKRRKMYRLAKKADGPKSYPIIGCAHIFRGTTEDILNTVLKLMDHYVPVTKVWLGTDLFYGITKPEHFEIILNHPKAQNKHDLYKFIKPLVGNGLFSAPVHIWKKSKKLLSPTFNQKILNNFVSTFYEQSVILTDMLDKNTKQIFNMKHFVGKYTLDAVAKTAMGVELNEQTSDSEIGKLLDRTAEHIFKRMFQIWYQPDIIFYNLPIGKDFMKNVKTFLDYSDKVIQERKKQYKEHKEWCRQYPEAETDERSKLKTFLELLFELNDNDNQLTDEELRDEVNTFLIAGSDTTSIALSFAFVMLGMHSNYQQIVYDEVMDAIGPDRPIEHDDLPNLKFTERFLQETNRLFPVGPLVVRTNTGDIDLGDCTLPEGSASALIILYTHRSEKYWKDPLIFDPDRFLPEEVAKRHPYAYIPFTAGPRMCIGKKYGMMMMKVAIAHVIRKFKLTTPYKNVADIRLRQDTLIQPVEGYKLQLELRERI